MAALKTFRFDLDFDDPKYNVDISEVDEKPADLEKDVQAIEPEVETYSEADLEIARQSGFESGKEVATVEAQENLEVKIVEIMNLIYDQFSELEAKQLKFNRQLESQTISLINSVHQKIYPVTGSLIAMNGGDVWHNITVRDDEEYVKEFKEADYWASRVTSGVDFRAKNLESFDSL